MYHLSVPPISAQDTGRNRFRVSDEMVGLASGILLPHAQPADETLEEQTLHYSHIFVLGVVIDPPDPSHGRIAIADVKGVPVRPHSFGVTGRARDYQVEIG